MARSSAARWLLVGVFWLVWTAVPAAPAAPRAGCDAPRPRALVERFIPADCTTCWADARREPATKTLVLDWIVPTHDDAPMASAALPEARARSAGEATRRWALPARPVVQSMRVVEGPAVYGHVGIRFTARPLPAARDASLFIALVEQVAPGQEGSRVPRRLVRALIGPVELSVYPAGEPIDAWWALRFPEQARPERLSALAWIERADGRVVGAVASANATCPERE